MSKPADRESMDLLAELDAEFGKKSKKKAKEITHKELNRAFHLANPPLENATGKIDWVKVGIPEARVTYVIRQHCRCCGNTVEFIGGEYIKFRAGKQHATILRRAEVCTDILHYGTDDAPLPDLIDEFDQEVSRCPGCIAVEQRALEIWESATGKKLQDELDLGDLE